MARAEDDRTSPPLLGTVQPIEHLRNTVRRAGRQMDLEQNRTVVTIARAFEEINDVESRADLQTRMLMLEERVERLSARPSELDQELQSQVSVLKTTVASALEAINTQPPEKPQQEAPLHWPPKLDAVEALRKEFEAKLLEARSDLRYEIIKVSKDLEAPPAGSPAVDEVRAELLARVEESEQKAAKAAVYLEELIAVQRQELERERTRHVDVMARLSRELANFSRTLAGAQPEVD